MAINQSQDGWAKTALRLPKEMHEHVHAAAKSEDRTFNGQLIALLREAFAARRAQGTKS